MSAFVPILAALHLAVPVHCYKTDNAFDNASRAAGVGAPVAAFYTPGKLIALSPTSCRDVLEPNLEGADTLAHELAHHWQYVNGLTMWEPEAIAIARWARRGLLRVLERTLGRKAGPDPIVRITP